MAAPSLSAMAFGAFREVTLPLILPGVPAGALFAFITPCDELVTSPFLPGANALTPPRGM
jgi:putative spermidine/putrescine transport system permease protein